ncbi:hypothetical protein PsAD2_01381 [Pseudovibrio axinellae]|uniref:Uncharacterized protein n=1 Tax=Pseudovibrio axinellae TaxID=989403 RepID=A0A166A1H5_9HYPH|nr:hypothetical protein [Pseudovibrio axinellae]KZL20526.1 hypothetical protein PsAD2_01381 [Pseudovibrio axinellae]SEQ91191.1 hypothetical protein SAMN05421798_10591 [Pseudovibrio axinellae]
MFGQMLQHELPGMRLSFGTCRNGLEVIAKVRADGEWARSSQAGLTLEEGGADFVTVQAAVELQRLRDAERQGYIGLDHNSNRYCFEKDISEYTPETALENLKIEVCSMRGASRWRKLCKITI